MKKVMIAFALCFFGFMGNAYAVENNSNNEFNLYKFSNNVHTPSTTADVFLRLGYYDFQSRWKPKDDNLWDSSDIKQQHVFMGIGIDSPDVGFEFKFGGADITSTEIFDNGDDFEDAAMIFMALELDFTFYTTEIFSIGGFATFNFYGPYDDETDLTAILTERLDLDSRWGTEVGLLFKNPRDANINIWWGPYYYINYLKAESTITNNTTKKETLFDTKYRENGRAGLRAGAGIHVGSGVDITAEIWTKSKLSWLVGINFYF
ncbi:MAG: hypothetical protein HY606_12255 [Planctomycetes bacterium]|nr:hypothetical protein [Planctomycetota bacterium]